MLGVNLGRLGFLAEIQPEDLDEILPQIVAGEYRVVKHLMFECSVHRGGREVSRTLGLNEAVVLAGPPFSMIEVQLYVDADLATTYSCDGLIVSTPVGSTAHNLAAGGPIMEKSLQTFVVSPICPHTLTNRPVVDSADHVYELAVPQPNEGTSLLVDGKPIGQVTGRRSNPHRTLERRVPADRSSRPRLLPHAAREARLGRATEVEGISVRPMSPGSAGECDVDDAAYCNATLRQSRGLQHRTTTQGGAVDEHLTLLVRAVSSLFSGTSLRRVAAESPQPRRRRARRGKASAPLQVRHGRSAALRRQARHEDAQQHRRPHAAGRNAKRLGQGVEGDRRAAQRRDGVHPRRRVGEDVERVARHAGQRLRQPHEKAAVPRGFEQAPAPSACRCRSSASPPTAR